MRNRSIRVRTSMSQDEFTVFKARLMASGLGTEEYIRRQLLHGELTVYRDKKARQELLKKVAREVNAIGTNINQVAHMANISRSVHPDRIRELLKKLDDVCGIVNQLTEE